MLLLVFFSVKYSRSYVSWSLGFIARELICVVLMTKIMSSRALIYIPSLGFFADARCVSKISARIGM